MGERSRNSRLVGQRPEHRLSVFMILLCFIAPWLAMFIRGHVFQGVLCIILHLTLIGWIPATIWALIVTRREGVA